MFAVSEKIFTKKLQNYYICCELLEIDIILVRYNVLNLFVRSVLIGG